MAYAQQNYNQKKMDVWAAWRARKAARIAASSGANTPNCGLCKKVVPPNRPDNNCGLCTTVPRRLQYPFCDGFTTQTGGQSMLSGGCGAGTFAGYPMGGCGYH